MQPICTAPTECNSAQKNLKKFVKTIDKYVTVSYNVV